MPSTAAEALESIADDHAWRDIPLLAWRLLIHHWPALLFWFFFGQLAYSLLLNLAITLAGYSQLLAYAALSVLVVSQLIAVTGMLLAIRPGLPVLSQRDVPQVGTPTRNWAHMVGLVLLPFFAYYATWGLLDGLRRQFTLDYIFSVPMAQQESLQSVLALHGLWAALLVAATIRHFARKRAEAIGGFFWLLLATICEAYWVFVGVHAIKQAYGVAWAWWHQRVAYVAWLHWWQDPQSLLHMLAPIKHALQPAWDVLTTVLGGAILPLVWLAIAATIYGMDLKQSRGYDANDERFARIGARYTSLPLLVRKMAGKASHGWTNKGMPLLNSLRLVLRAGLPAVVVLCVLFQLLQLVDSWAWRWLVLLVGPHSPDWWHRIGQTFAIVVGGPLSTRPSMLTQPLLMVLLAATFDRAIARLSTARQVAAAQGKP